eukprot:XP_001706771.1 Hypothetical protein GL50803_37733 [Giardia lamblia ATCC 50803]
MLTYSRVGFGSVDKRRGCTRGGWKRPNSGYLRQSCNRAKN